MPAPDEKCYASILSAHVARTSFGAVPDHPLGHCPRPRLCAAHARQPPGSCPYTGVRSLVALRRPGL
jgi:hypothetical protein